MIKQLFEMLYQVVQHNIEYDTRFVNALQTIVEDFCGVSDSKYVDIMVDNVEAIIGDDIVSYWVYEILYGYHKSGGVTLPDGTEFKFNGTLDDIPEIMRYLEVTKNANTWRLG